MNALYSQNLRKVRLPAVVASLGFLGLMVPSVAFGADPVACTAYAERSVAQQQENIQRGCGFQSLRWNNNGPAAYIFCMGVGEDLAGAETVFREQKLSQCRADQGAGQAQNNNQNNGQGNNQGNNVGDDNGGGQPQGNNGDNSNGGGIVAQGIVLEPELTLEVNQPFGGPQGQAEGDGVADLIYDDVIISAQISTAGRDCQIAISSTATGDSQQAAMDASQAIWHNSATAQFGSGFGYFPGANGATFYCGGKNGVHSCTAVGQPCNNIAAIEPTPVVNDPQPAADQGGGGFGVVENGQSALQCVVERHTVERTYRREKSPLFYQWVKGQWEYEVSQRYGFSFGRIVDAQDPYITCKNVAGWPDEWWECSAAGLPCYDAAKEQPTCFAEYVMYVDFDANPLSTWDLKLEWSRRVATLYGQPYGNWDYAIDTREGQYYKTTVAGKAEIDFDTANFERDIRYVAGRPCRRN